MPFSLWTVVLWHPTLPVVAPVQSPRYGEQRLVGHGFNLERTPPRMCSSAPDRGEHTDEILAELGYSGAEIDRLRTARVV